MLEVDGLTKRYGTTLALSDLSFSVRPGEVYGFVGANGAGKTTAMRIMLGVLAADSGVVRWQGQPVTFETRRRFGYMPEERGLYPKMRVTEHLVYLARLHGLDRGDRGPLGRRADRAARRRRAPQRRDREAVARQPAAGPAGRRAGARPRGARPGRAVLRPGPGRRGRPGRRPAGACPSRRAGRVLLAISSTWSSGSATRSGSSTPAGWSPPAPCEDLRAQEGRRQLLVIVRDAPAGWAGAIPGVTWCPSAAASWCSSWPTASTTRRCSPPRVRAGRVEHFSWRQPTLTELFREAVAEADGGTPADGGRDRQGVAV